MPAITVEMGQRVLVMPSATWLPPFVGEPGPCDGIVTEVNPDGSPRTFLVTLATSEQIVVNAMAVPHDDRKWEGTWHVPAEQIDAPTEDTEDAHDS